STQPSLSGHNLLLHQLLELKNMTRILIAAALFFAMCALTVSAVESTADTRTATELSAQSDARP
ncbi:MAG: hypothetical protein ACXWCP_21700, partial [Burkholderiales bacterium]